MAKPPFGGRKAKADATVATVGIRASKDIQVGKTKAKVTLGVGYRHASNSLPGVSIHQLSDGSAFAISGVPIDRNAAVLEAGVDVPVSERAKFNVNYQAQISSKLAQHTVGAKFSYRF